MTVHLTTTEITTNIQVALEALSVDPNYQSMSSELLRMLEELRTKHCRELEQKDIHILELQSQVKDYQDLYVQELLTGLMYKY